jgi:hypothetical protein
MYIGSSKVFSIFIGTGRCAGTRASHIPASIFTATTATLSAFSHSISDARTDVLERILLGERTQRFQPMSRPGSAAGRTAAATITARRPCGEEANVGQVVERLVARQGLRCRHSLARVGDAGSSDFRQSRLLGLRIVVPEWICDNPRGVEVGEQLGTHGVDRIGHLLGERSTSFAESLQSIG